MASVTALTNLNLRDLWREVKDPTTLWGDVSQQTLRTVKLLLENRMHEELADFLNAGFYTRGGSRRGYRNGRYVRQLTTTYGTIPDLEIPRARHRGFAPSVLPRYRRRTRDVDTLIRRVFLGGLSTRQVGPILSQLLHDTVSPTTVSAITQSLDQAVQRTTNAIERAFREIRRRTRPMTCFTNLASCDRIIYAVIHALNLRRAGRSLAWETTQNS